MGVSGHIGSVFEDSEEVGRCELFHEGVRFGVEIEFDGVAAFFGGFVCEERCGVVSADLDIAGAERSGAVVFIEDESLHGFQSAFVICAGGDDHHDEGIAGSGGDADLGCGSDEERAHVEGAACSIGRDVVGIGGDDAIEGFKEQFDGDGCHAGAASGPHHAFGIGLRAESDDFSVFLAEGFETFEAFLTVVQAGSGHVDIQVGFLYERSGVPLSILPNVFDVTGRIAVLKTEVVPIKIDGHRVLFL